MKKKIVKELNKVKSSKDATVLLSNFGYLTLLQVASFLFPMITIPYLAKVIGVDNFGKIAFATAVIVWFQTIADWGFNYTATRDVAKNRDDKEIISEIFSNVLWSRVLLAFFSFVLLILLVLTVPRFGENKVVILITFLIVPGQIMFPDWFFQAMEKMKYITVFNVISKLLFTLAVFVFIKQKSDYILQPLFTSLGFVISGLFSMYIILVKMNVKLKKPSLPSIYNTIKGSTDVFLNNLLPNFYNSFSILLLGFFCGPASNGILDASRKFTTVAHQFMGIISRVFFPYLSRRIDKHALFAKMYLSFATIGSLFLFLFAPFIIKLFFTPEFYDAILVLRITSFSIIFIALSSVYGRNYMILEGYEKELRNITFKVTVIGFLISFPLIYYLDYLGAAIMLILVQAISGISIMFKALRIKRYENRSY